MVTIRLRRAGSKKRPFFRVVVTDSRAARDSSFVEILGHYNPRTRAAVVQVDTERVDYWLGKGAQASDSVRTLIARRLLEHPDLREFYLRALEAVAGAASGWLESEIAAKAGLIRAAAHADASKQISNDEFEAAVASLRDFAQRRPGLLDAAQQGDYAYPAINVTSIITINAALKAFSDSRSDGIIQISTGGAEYLSGPSVKDMVTGSVAFASFAAEVAKKYPVNVALHTDHCPKDKLDGFVRPLLDISAERVARGEAPLFQSHMWDGSAIDLEENLQIAEELLAKAAAAKIILEVEIGVVGGEEDGVSAAMDEKLYTAEGDFVRTVETLGSGDQGRYLLAATFGNVHGVYKPGNVKLRPEILKAAQEAVVKELGLAADARPFDLVFHGGSGSTAEEIGAAVDYGVVKMNIDTDTQYAFTRPIADHMFKNYLGVLKVDGEVGDVGAVETVGDGSSRSDQPAIEVGEAFEHAVGEDGP